jgi:hypothetical protein
VDTTVPQGSMCALETQPSSHATPSSTHRRSTLIRPDDVTTLVIFNAARRWQLPTFCTFAVVSNYKPTRTPGLYLLPSLSALRSSLPIDNTAWLADACLPSSEELAAFVNAPPGIIITMSKYPTSSRSHGFLGSEGFRSGDTIRLVGNSVLEGGGRIRQAVFAPDGDGRFVYEVTGWTRVRGSPASETSLLLLSTNAHSPGNTTFRAPRQWIIVLA